ncbi:MAG TPA: DUF948 domain-containing protein [Vicinamibacterales bacterium]
MTDIFLGVIAVSVLAMAVVQVAIVVGAWRAAKQAGEAARRLEQEIKPMMANLQAMSADLARTSALVTAQVERLDQVTTSVARRVEETTASLQSSILTPIKDAYAFLHGLKSALAALGITRPARDEDQGPPPRPAAPSSDRPTATDDPDLFV